MGTSMQFLKNEIMGKLKEPEINASNKRWKYLYFEKFETHVSVKTKTNNTTENIW